MSISYSPAFRLIIEYFCVDRQRVYKLEDEQGYNPRTRAATAFAKAQEWGDRIPIGVIYRNARPVYEEHLAALKAGPLVKQKLEPHNAEQLLDEFV